MCYDTVLSAAEPLVGTDTHTRRCSLHATGAADETTASSRPAVKTQTLKPSKS